LKQGFEFELLYEVERASDEEFIPRIGRDDGAALFAVVFYYTSRKRTNVVVLDGGAGIGYSTLWLYYALESSCVSGCRLVAVEVRRERAEKLRELLYRKLKPRSVSVEVVHGDFVEFVSRLRSNSVDIAFVDVAKHQYIEAFRALRDKIVSGGVVAFHNAYMAEKVVQTIVSEASEESWTSTVIPTEEGILLVVKP